MPSIKKIKDSKNHITLKQAAEISGYSSDYIGQLIRQGKIAGKQVYYNTAWVTTEDEVRKYLTNKAKGKDPSVIRGQYLRIKHNLSDWVFSFSPMVVIKSFTYSFIILIFITTGILFLTNSTKDLKTEITSPEITRIIEYDKTTKKIINTTELPYIP